MQPRPTSAFIVFVSGKELPETRKLAGHQEENKDALNPSPSGAKGLRKRVGIPNSVQDLTGEDERQEQTA
ncbi:hypothetical protein E4U61_003879 [Claviceps capensis]|nr:hypothetical protein E4U61_003879 [Claviceps capensis]